MNRVRIDCPLKFEFSCIFDSLVSQQNVFDEVCTHVLDGLFEGINGTVFVYGQTGSGKTYTMTGSPMSYSDRGIIPRCLEDVFARIQKFPNDSFEVSISYVEIYNEEVFDLLGTASLGGAGVLSKVYPFEDNDAKVRLRGVQTHVVATAHHALSLLFKGDACRVVAETTMNDCSTRSHCIFNINVQRKIACTVTETASTLRLVDLAGSERFRYTDSVGTLFNEGRSINLSLHYLEQVIVALNEKLRDNRVHVPYRNSVLTWILRDSLGGSSRTSMIATISMDENYINESVSTCRFANRVSFIENAEIVNSHIEPHEIVSRLVMENSYLKGQLRALQGNDSSDADLTSDEIQDLRERIREFLHGPPSANFCIDSFQMVRASWQIFHQLYNSDKSVETGTVELKCADYGTEPLRSDSRGSGEKRDRACDSVSAKAQLKELCQEGRALGVEAANLRSEISVLVAKSAASQPGSGDLGGHIELRREILNKHSEYTSKIVELKKVKSRIDDIKRHGCIPLSDESF